MQSVVLRSLNREVGGCYTRKGTEKKTRNCEEMSSLGF
jgi:hypothetical protein